MIPTIFIAIFGFWQLWTLIHWWKERRRLEGELSSCLALSKRLQNECYWLRDRLKEATEAAEKPIEILRYNDQLPSCCRFTSEGGFERINED